MLGAKIRIHTNFDEFPGYNNNDDVNPSHLEVLRCQKSTKQHAATTQESMYT